MLNAFQNFCLFRAAHVFESSKLEQTLMNENSLFNKTITKATRQKLLKNPGIKNEYEFYDFVKQRFEMQYKAVFLDSDKKLQMSWNSTTTTKAAMKSNQSKKHSSSSTFKNQKVVTKNKELA